MPPTDERVVGAYAYVRFLAIPPILPAKRTLAMAELQVVLPRGGTMLDSVLTKVLGLIQKRVGDPTLFNYIDAGKT